jgi:stringent starvation protein B
MLPSRSYLLRAMHEWIVDSGLTPHLLVDADDPDLQVPDSARGDGKVVLNISPSAVRDLLMDRDLVTFVARFGGVSRAVSVPMNAVEGIYARENGRGMMFPDEDALSGDDPGPDDDGGSPGTSRQPRLRVVK